MNYTKTQIRTAILRAADHIARNPNDFNWKSVHVGGCGTPACAVGWIGAFLGIPATGKYPNGAPYKENIETVAKAVGVHNMDFYRRMRGIDKDWRTEHARIAPALRAYADKYFPAEVIADPTHIPCSAQFLTQLSSWMRKGERQVVT